MKKFFAICLLSLPMLMACGPLPPLVVDTGEKRALNTVDLRQPDVTLTFLSTGEKYRTDDMFPPPKTIDCSHLRRTPDAFKDAIEAGALVVQIQTPPKAKKKLKDKDGKEIFEIVNIKPTYSGVLALCKVSPHATGAESRSYHIRDLDEYLVMGKDSLISVVAAKLSQNNQADPFQELLNINMGPSLQAIGAGRDSYSWMLWLTDNQVIFTDYEAEVAKRKTLKPLLPPAPSQTP